MTQPQRPAGWGCACEQAHSKAFNVASALPERFLSELQIRIDQLVATGASFHEAGKELLPLLSDLKKNQAEWA